MLKLSTLADVVRQTSVIETYRPNSGNAVSIREDINTMCDENVGKLFCAIDELIHTVRQMQHECEIPIHRNS